MDKIKEFYGHLVAVGELLEVRIQNTKKGWMMSKYVRLWDELEALFKEYGSDEWNIYIGINSREKEGKKDIDIKWRRFFYFDVEADGEKPPLTDKVYFNQLQETVMYLIKGLKAGYDLRPFAIVKSGRGMHLYYKIKKIDAQNTKKQFVAWFKEMQDRLDKAKPHKGIKFTDSVFNVSRIASAPGTKHMKYPEQPFRSVMYLNSANVNNINGILRSVKLPERKIVIGKVQQARNFDEKTIFESPEFQLLAQYENLPEGELHTHIIFAIKLLMQANGITNFEEMQSALDDLGYPAKEMYIPEDRGMEEYNYTTGILINWCCRNYEWCVENKYKIPYPIKSRCANADYIIKNDKDHKPTKPIETYVDALEYIKEFNDKTMVDTDEHIEVSESILAANLEKANPMLWEFIQTNKMWTKIRFYRTTYFDENSEEE